MDDAFLAQLRCPLDPAREATLRAKSSSSSARGAPFTFPSSRDCPFSCLTRPPARSHA